MLIDDGLAALDSIANFAPQFIKSNGFAIAARAYGRCGDEAAAREWAGKAVDAATGLSAEQKILMLENLYRAGIEF